MSENMELSFTVEEVRLELHTDPLRVSRALTHPLTPPPPPPPLSGHPAPPRLVIPAYSTPPPLPQAGGPSSPLSQLTLHRSQVTALLQPSQQCLLTAAVRDCTLLDTRPGTPPPPLYWHAVPHWGRTLPPFGVCPPLGDTQSPIWGHTVPPIEAYSL